MQLHELHEFISLKNSLRPNLFPNFGDGEIQKLENGFMIRQATIDDRERMFEFNSIVHGSNVL